MRFLSNRERDAEVFIKNKPVVIFASIFFIGSTDGRVTNTWIWSTSQWHPTTFKRNCRNASEK